MLLANESNKQRRSFLWLVLFTLVFMLAALIIYQVIEGDDGHDLELTFMDVGQGDAILVSTPSIKYFNNQEILIDGGPGRSVLGELSGIRSFWDRKIEYVIATHPDADHIGGLVAAVNKYQVGTLIDNAEIADTPIYESYLNASQKIPQHLPVNKVAMIKIDPVTTITFLPVPKNLKDRNDNSIIIRLDHLNSSALLTGDASSQVEQYLIDNYQSLIDVDLLKLGHHGSRTSTSKEFLLATSPDQVIISAPLDSRYGHPHPEVINNLLDYNQVEIYFTGRDGTTTFIPSEFGFQLKK